MLWKVPSTTTTASNNRKHQDLRNSSYDASPKIPQLNLQSPLIRRNDISEENGQLKHDFSFESNLSSLQGIFSPNSNTTTTQMAPYIRHLHYKQQLFDALYNEESSRGKLTLLVLKRDYGRERPQQQLQQLSHQNQREQQGYNLRIQRDASLGSSSTTYQQNKLSLSILQLQHYYFPQNQFLKYKNEFQILWMSLSDAPDNILQVHRVHHLPHAYKCLIFRDGKLLTQHLESGSGSLQIQHANRDGRWYRTCVAHDEDEDMYQVAYYIRTLLEGHVPVGKKRAVAGAGFRVRKETSSSPGAMRSKSLRKKTSTSIKSAQGTRSSTSNRTPLKKSRRQSTARKHTATPTTPSLKQKTRYKSLDSASNNISSPQLRTFASRLWQKDSPSSPQSPLQISKCHSSNEKRPIFQRLFGSLDYRQEPSTKSSWLLFVCIGWIHSKVYVKFATKLLRMMQHTNASIDRDACSLICVDVSEEDVAVKYPHAASQLEHCLWDAGMNASNPVESDPVASLLKSSSSLPSLSQEYSSLPSLAQTRSLSSLSSHVNSSFPDRFQILQLTNYTHRAHFLHQLGEESVEKLESEPVLYVVSQRSVKPAYLHPSKHELRLSNYFVRALSFQGTQTGICSNPEIFLSHLNKWREQLAVHSYHRVAIQWKKNLENFDFQLKNIHSKFRKASHGEKHLRTIFPLQLLAAGHSSGGTGRSSGKGKRQQVLPSNDKTSSSCSLVNMLKALRGKHLIGILTIYEGVGDGMKLFLKKVAQLQSKVRAYNSELFELVILPICENNPEPLLKECGLDECYRVPHDLKIKHYSLGHNFEQLHSAYTCNALGIPVETCALHVVRLDHPEGFIFEACDYMESFRLDHPMSLFFRWMDNMTLEKDYKG